MHNALCRALSAVVRYLELSELRTLRRWLRLAVFIFLFGLITHGHFAGSGDAPHYMLITHSLAFDRDFDLANNYADPRSLFQDGGVAVEAHARAGERGRLRPVHDVGLPLLGAPYFGLAHGIAERLTPVLPDWLLRRARLDRWIMLRQLMSLAMILVTSELAVMFFDLTVGLSQSRAQGIVVALVWAISAPVLSHGFVYIPEVPSALVALAVFRSLRRLATASPWGACGLGLLTGGLLLLHIRNIGLSLGLLGLGVLRLQSNRRRAAAFVVGFLAAAGFRTGLNLHFWGSPLTTPHARWSEWPGLPVFLEEVASRALGLCLDQRHGLLYSAPIYLLAPAGWWLLKRRGGRTAWELLSLFLLYLAPILIPMTNLHGWRGGWSAAARFLVPVSPFLGLAASVCLAESHRRSFMFLLMAFQSLLNAFIWGHPMLLWDEGAGFSRLLVALGGEGLVSLLPVWGAPVGRHTVMISVVLLVCWGLLTAWLVRNSSRASRASAMDSSRPAVSRPSP